MRIELAIAEDDDVLREALMKLFHTEVDMVVVLAAVNGSDLLQQLTRVQPDVILMDIRMPVMDGVEATRQVLARYPHAKVIAHTNYADETTIIAMYRLGVKSFIGKSANTAELLNAIRVVHNGGNYMTNETLAIFNEHLGAQHPEQEVDAETQLNSLSLAELKVLWHTARLQPIKQIADALHVSPHTVNNHQYNLRKKFNLSGRHSLAQFAVAIRRQLKERIELLGNS